MEAEDMQKERIKIKKNMRITVRGQKTRKRICKGK
jgi:hypothetical protein